MRTMAKDQFARLSDWKMIRAVFPYMKRQLKLFILSLIILPFYILIPLSLPQLVKIMIDRYVLVGNWHGSLTLASLFLSLLILNFCIVWAMSFVTEVIGLRIVKELRRDLFFHFQTLPLPFFRKNAHGRLVTRLTTDLDHINEAFASGAITLLANILSMIGIALAMIHLDVHLGLITLTMVPVLILFAAYIRHVMRKIFRNFRVLIAKINSFSQEALSGLIVIKLFGQEKRFQNQFHKINRAYFKETLRSNLYEACFYGGIDFFGTLAVGILIWKASSNTVSAGILIAMVQYIHQFFVPIRTLGAKFATMQQAFSALERVLKLMEEDTEIKSSELNILEKKGQRKAWSKEKNKTQIGKIEFKNVNFSYFPNEPVIQNISFSLAPGEKIALVGETGAGKSTLARLCMGFYKPQSGKILFDGKNIKEMNLLELRSRISLLPQEAFLFNASLQDNLIFDRKIETESFKNILAQVGLEGIHERFHRESDNSGGKMGEWGRWLSEGEKQLVSAGRAISQNPEIIIMDEATSAMDPLSDRKVRAAFRACLQGRSALMIAHRLSTLEDADKIIVLHKGKIEEEGSHERLMKKNGRYQRLYRLYVLREELITQTSS